MSRVEAIRNKEVHLKQIEAIYLDGKNMPVNFQELMEEITLRKTYAEQLNTRIADVLIVRKMRRRVDTKKKAADGEDSGEDREAYFRSLLADA